MANSVSSFQGQEFILLDDWKESSQDPGGILLHGYAACMASGYHSISELTWQCATSCPRLEVTKNVQQDLLTFYSKRQ